QIARCLRDEDLRANRQPEFTQLDLEMSFVEMEHIFEIIEGLTAAVFQQTIGVEIPLPLPRLQYADAMLKYGSDKPDLRYDFEIVDISDLAAETEFQAFRAALESGGKVRGLNAKGGASKISRKQLDNLPKTVAYFAAKGLISSKVEADSLGSLSKFFTGALADRLRERMQAEPGDLLMFVADSQDVVEQSLGHLRAHLAAHLGLYDPNDKSKFKIAWVIDFPLFTYDKEEQRWAANHHPFTAPLDEDLAKLESDTANVRAKAYDLVINGDECGGGSIRIHSPEVQSRVFSILGMPPEQAKARFGFLLDALKFGAPPHGGIALGLDRWAMMLTGTNNIRDVIAFPKNQKARDLMTGAPAPVDAKQLKELGL
ncbi:MAG: aspartate--tRNA ligase, partial [Planctomycetia bacterium]|nr:aspartate--tRNA ligase [Planctomycetia bacterium]